MRGFLASRRWLLVAAVTASCNTLTDGNTLQEDSHVAVTDGFGPRAWIRSNSGNLHVKKLEGLGWTDLGQPTRASSTWGGIWPTVNPASEYGPSAVSWLHSLGWVERAFVTDKDGALYTYTFARRPSSSGGMATDLGPKR